MAHAIDRLFATPNTTAVLPFKSSNMHGSPGRRKKKKKNNSILNTTVLFRRRSHSLPRPNGPAGAAERDRIDRRYHAEAGRQADSRCNPSHTEPERHLQQRAEEIKSVLYAPHDMRRPLLHQTSYPAHPLNPAAP